jgi:hypothetical protein
MPKTLVKKITGKQVESWLKTSDELYCIIEIKKEGCNACVYNGRILDLLSLKFKE